MYVYIYIYYHVSLSLYIYRERDNLKSVLRSPGDGPSEAAPSWRSIKTPATKY